VNSAAIWFRRAVWLGIVADWLLALPAIFAPEKLLDLLGFRATADPMWTAFGGLLVFLLSLFYIPGANQPYRYRFSAWFAVLARLPGVVFFLVLNPGLYPAFGFFDGGFFVLQFPLLLLVMRARPREEKPAPQALQARSSDRSVAWLRGTLWLGIVVDLVLGVPAIFWPEQVLDSLGMRQTMDPVWTAFSALILVLVAIFYIPGANHPFHYRYNAWLAVFARLFGALFFLTLWSGLYPAFGVLDGFLFGLQVPFLVAAMRPTVMRR